MKKIFKLKINTITPIHIFSGDYFYDYEFFIKDKKLYLVDIDKIFKNFYLKNHLYLIIDNFFSKKDYLFKKELDFFYIKNFDYLTKKNLIIDQIDIKLNEEEIERLESQKINKFITYYDINNEKEKVFIPGSSVKGAFIDIFKKYLDEKKFMYDNKILRKTIGFSDFYFTSKESWIQKITRIKPINGELIEGNKIMIQLVQGEAEGEVFFINDNDNQNIFVKFKNLFYEGGEIVKKKRKFNVSYSSFFSQELIDEINQAEDLIMLLGFGSLSYESFKYKYPKTYYSYNLKDPLGVISLEIIS